MKDIDFDELDKAVNSLMTNVPKANEPREVREKTLDLTPSPSNVPATTSPATPPVSSNSMPRPSVPSVSSQPSAASTPATESSAPQTPPASRRGGRFMDVVHPSSDMKGQTPSVPSRPVSRQGVSVEPRPGAAQPEERPSQPAPSPMLGAPVQGVSSVAPPPVVTEKTPPASEWPDPLEMTSFKNNREEPEKEAPTPIEMPSVPDEQVVKPEVQGEEGKEEQSPLTSPFLPGAKVEKRPLGGPTDEPDRTPLLGAETAKTADNPNDQLPALPEDVEPLLPEELQGDMMAVEADTHKGMPKTEETHPLKEEPMQPEEEPAQLEPKLESAPVKPEKEASTPPPVTSPAEKSSPTEPKTPTGPTSIPQQYREEPSTGDKKSGAIYDTDAYHKPLAHPAKKKSGWLWVLWIVIILLVGAGTGAALYLLDIV